ncbi:tetratricopeptide repeat protein [bacterium]|nr:tetratricopeptide repeat protein [bacterium]
MDEKLALTDRALELNREADRRAAVGRHSEAIALYRQALETQPDLELLYSKIITLYEQAGELNQIALLRYQQYSLRFSTATALDYYELGSQFQHLDDLHRAEDCYRWAIALDPGLARAYLRLGRSLVGQGKIRSALRWYFRAVLLKLRYKLGLLT